MARASKLYSEAVLRLKTISPFPEKESLRLLSSTLKSTSTTKLMLEIQNLELSKFEVTQFEGLLKRRENHEPIAYILEEEYFLNRRFEVNPHVLIPRPETEILVDYILQTLDPSYQGTCLDIGTGSGVIAITMKLERPEMRAIGTDISQSALQTAQKNADSLNAKVQWVLADLTQPISRQSIDLLISNPPYIPRHHSKKLPPDVVQYEPHLALFAGEDGLCHILRLLDQGRRVLKPGGRMYLEIGEDQVEPIQRFCEEYNFRSYAFMRDFRGVPRFASIQP